ncbi:MobC family plasmid mobilization relaxosome protein [Listeria booriae]|nr:MobC family plasmid mobilization relaxosome protein [Listeria booriae]
MFEIACWGNPQTPIFKIMERERKKIKMTIRKRNMELKFRVTEEEKAFIELKMKEAGITNREAYLRKMAIDGAIVVSNHMETKRLILELNKIGNNINQMTHVANRNKHISQEDIETIKELMQNIWQLQRYGLSKKHSTKQ